MHRLPHEDPQIAQETGRSARSRLTPRISLGLTLALCAGLGACAPAQGDVLVSRLRECGVLSSGEIGPYVLSGLYAPDACYERCLAEASCERLETGLCRTMLDLLVACDERCAFRCDDGSLLGPERVCDGARQCMEGEDERDCDFDLVCNDGSRVPGARCDGAWNCPDGSDEQACPGRTGIDCGDRSGTYYDWQRCDGYRSCGNGADEAGCPSFVCGDGSTVTYRDGASGPRCDGYAQCGDGSDERSCARLTLVCSP